MLSQHVRTGLSLALGLGFGIGLMAGALLWALGTPKPMTDAQVEARARSALGMVKATELKGARVTLVIRPDTKLSDLGDMLKAAGLDGDGFLAKAKAKYPEAKPKPGVQAVTAGDTPDQLVDQLLAP